MIRTRYFLFVIAYMATSEAFASEAEIRFLGGLASSELEYLAKMLGMKGFGTNKQHLLQSLKELLVGTAPTSVDVHAQRLLSEALAELCFGNSEASEWHSTGLPGRTAICITGQSRALGLKYPEGFLSDDLCGHRPDRTTVIRCSQALNESALGPVDETMGEVASSVHHHLYSSLAKSGGFDVFLFTHSHTGEPQPVFDHLRPAAASALTDDVENEFFIRVAPPDVTHQDLLSLDRWGAYEGPSGQKLLWQLYDQFMCAEMVREHVKETGITYKYAMRYRPDLAFVAPFPLVQDLNLGSIEQPIIRYGSKSSCCCGNEDMLGIGHFDTMMHYLSRFTTLISVTQHDDHLYRMYWSSESFLEEFLSLFHNASLKQDERIRHVHPRTILAWRDKARVV